MLPLSRESKVIEALFGIGSGPKKGEYYEALKDSDSNLIDTDGDEFKYQQGFVYHVKDVNKDTLILEDPTNEYHLNRTKTNSKANPKFDDLWKKNFKSSDEKKYTESHGDWKAQKEKEDQKRQNEEKTKQQKEEERKSWEKSPEGQAAKKKKEDEAYAKSYSDSSKSKEEDYNMKQRVKQKVNPEDQQNWKANEPY